LLRFAQKHGGASQTRIASVTGMAQGRVSEILSGHRSVGSLNLIERIANGLGMPDHARVLLGLAPRSRDILPECSTRDSHSLPEAMARTAAETKGRFALESVDHALVAVFEQQTQNLRLVDRKLGAHYLLAQSQAHVQQMHELLRSSVPGEVREALARALAEAASLTGWQALNAGLMRESWNYYEIAKTAARESQDPVILAHVSGEQVYVLLDNGQARQALEVLRAVHEARPRSLPPLLRSWLWAAEAETQATLADETRAQRTMERAFRVLPDGPADPALPFLMLNETHLLRWRGHCLARLGSSEAIEDLTVALDDLANEELGRAEAGLRADLALAYSAHGDVPQARRQARLAADLADRTGSVRQRSRLAGLLRGSGPTR
jgi:transcriptional regulator with XRE-family HTH domain